jgi:hypothetical protein
MKTRYAKPFEGVQVKIPYETGMDPYSGLVDFFESKGVLVKSGNKLAYTTSSGEIMSEFRKNWTGDKLDIIMNEWGTKDFDDESEELEAPVEENLEVKEEA